MIEFCPLCKQKLVCISYQINWTIFCKTKVESSFSNDTNHFSIVDFDESSYVNLYHYNFGIHYTNEPRIWGTSGDEELNDFELPKSMDDLVTIYRKLECESLFK